MSALALDKSRRSPDAGQGEADDSWIRGHGPDCARKEFCGFGHRGPLRRYTFLLNNPSFTTVWQFHRLDPLSSEDHLPSSSGLSGACRGKVAITISQLRTKPGVLLKSANVPNGTEPVWDNLYSLIDRVNTPSGRQSERPMSAPLDTSMLLPGTRLPHHLSQPKRPNGFAVSQLVGSAKDGICARRARCQLPARIMDATREASLVATALRCALSESQLLNGPPFISSGSHRCVHTPSVSLELRWRFFSPSTISSSHRTRACSSSNIAIKVPSRPRYLVSPHHDEAITTLQHTSFWLCNCRATSN